MNYAQSLHYLNSFLNLEKLTELPTNSFFNLRRMEHLLKTKQPLEKNFLPVLIAGTTGKGSTGFFLESILRASGVKTGYYHSPHVEDVRERIRIDGKMISEALWVKGLSEIRKLLAKKPIPVKFGAVTYFEILTFLAILLFSKTKRQVGIFEVGLGGRLDATNVLKAPVTILTPVHLDHERFLGTTIDRIASEKAGIIKEHCCVVTGRQLPGALKVIKRAVRKNHARLWEAVPIQKFPISLDGDFQKGNAGIAMKTFEVLNRTLRIPMTKTTFSKAFRATHWPGRMERIHKFGAEFILDGAHNPFSVAAAVGSLKNRKRKEWVIFGAMQDKNSKAMLAKLARRFDKIIVTRISNYRAKPLGTLLTEAKNLFKCVLPAQNISEAFHFVKKNTGSGSRVIVIGSFYLIGEARGILKNG